MSLSDALDQAKAACALVMEERDVNKWLCAPNEALDGLTPIALVRAGQLARVLDLLTVEAE